MSNGLEERFQLLINLFKASMRGFAVGKIQVASDCRQSQPACGDQGCSGAHERIEDQITRFESGKFETALWQAIGKGAGW
jgi:hypothetical protein